MSDLLPCPFCGSDARVQKDDDRFYVACNGLDCYCAVGEGYDGRAMPNHIFYEEDAAADAWNRRAAIPASAQSAGMGWQPIETAPRDGVSFLVWVPSNRCIYAVAHNPLGGLRIFGGDFRDQLQRATHWMPMPAAPGAAVKAPDCSCARAGFPGSCDNCDDTSDPRWNTGCDFALTQLCKFLGVEPNDVSWDAATETVDGDVQAVIGNILRAKFGEDWGPSELTEGEPRGPSEPLQCLRCGTVDAFGPASRAPREMWAMLYLHDWDPPKEGQEHRWEPGKNVFPEIHNVYETLREANAVLSRMSDPKKYWVRRVWMPAHDASQLSSTDRGSAA